MQALEIFCGTKSFGKVATQKGYNVTSIDLMPRFKPTICANVLDIDILDIEKKVGMPSVIWASPPCIEYSRAKTKGKRNLNMANQLVMKTIAIIDFFLSKNPKLKWFLENPQTGLLPKQRFMEHIPYFDVDYCRFSDWGYRKRTRIWSNLEYGNVLCKGVGLCSNMIGRRHKNSCGNHSGHYTNNIVKKYEKYRIPPMLIETLLSSI